MSVCDRPSHSVHGVPRPRALLGGRAAWPCACLFALASAGLAGAKKEAVPQGGRVVEGVCPCADTLKPLSDRDPEVHKLLAPYNFAPAPFAWRMEHQRRLSRYDVHHLTFPSPVKTAIAENNTVHGEYYVPRQLAGRSPAVIVLHILDGRFIVGRLVCRYFAFSGTPALLVMMPYYGPRRPKGTSLRSHYRENPRRIFDAMQATVLECRRAACWLQKRPEVDPGRIGIVGVSLGAIAGGLAVGVDRRFTRNVLVLGGGDPAAILWHAPETAGVRKRLGELGYTLESIRKATLGIDPIRFARRVDRRHVLMINAGYDKTVPRRCTVALWEAMGKPAIRWEPAGHYSMSIFVPLILPLAHHFVLHGSLDPTAPRR